MIKEKLRKLRKFNFVMGSLHLIQAILMLAFALSWEKIREFTPQIFIYLLKFIPLEGLVPVPERLFNFPFGILVASFLFLSAIAHYIISLPKKTNDIYNNDLAKGINKFRWYEYALSSSIMIVAIAVLFGVKDFATLLAIFALNVSMNLFGLLMEKMNVGKEKIDWTPFVFGSIAGLIPWIIILMSGFGHPSAGDIPAFVYAIAGTYFVFFNLFPLNMVLQYKKIGKWKDYLYGENVYIILSLCAKTILAWLVLFGVMQP